MKIFAFVIFGLICFQARSQSVDEQSIRKLLHDQEIAWNQGNIEEFMKGYWNSDSLVFIGRSGLTYGYTQALNNYRKNYSDTVKMGQLKYDLLRIESLSSGSYFVIGKFFLKRSVGDIGGIFSLVFRKINGKWFIVVDHTS
jgi:hypothetical protein